MMVRLDLPVSSLLSTNTILIDKLDQCSSQKVGLDGIIPDS